MATLIPGWSPNALITELEMANGNDAVRGLLQEPFNTPRTAKTSFVEIRPATRQLTTLALVASSFGGPDGLLLDQDGSYVVGLNAIMYRIAPDNRVYQLAYNVGIVEGMTRDDDNGDYIVAANFLLSYLARVNPVSGLVTTLHSSNTFGIGSVQFDQRTGGFWVRYYNGPNEIQLIDRAGVIQRRIKVAPGVWHFRIDQRTSELYFLDGALMKRTTPTGTVLRTWGPLSSGIGAFVLYGSRKISGVGNAKPGSTYRFTLKFPESPGVGYCGALSLTGLRPGIPFPGERIHIVPDSLFSMTLCGGLAGLTQGFSGNLDASGSASAAFQIPSSLPRGIVLTFAAVAFNPRKPNRLDIGASSTVCVR